MRTIALYLGIFAAASTMFAACDVIDNPLPAPALPYNKRALDSVEAKLGFAAPVQKVLLEDFTGHQCGNCPGGALEANNQKAKYGDKLVVMSVHAGYFAATKKQDAGNPSGKYIYNFSTPAGEEWVASYKLAAWPNGMVNRTPASGSTNSFQGVSSWSGSIADGMANSPQVGMTLTPYYEAETRKLNIKVRSEYLTSLSGDYNLAVFITEDSMVNWQKNYAPGTGGDPNYPIGDVEKYKHSHVMRAAVDGAWGRLNKTNPTQGEVTEAYFAYNLDPTWNEKKVSVVAYIFDAKTKQVVQVEEKHLH